MQRIGTFWKVIVALGFAAMLSSCATCRPCYVAVPCSTPYWQVVLTDFEGCWISEYIAEGLVTEICDGVCFRAVQRRIFKPFLLTFKYPLGRPVKVSGSNIIVTPTGKPLWLRQSDRTLPPANTCSGTKYR